MSHGASIRSHMMSGSIRPSGVVTSISKAPSAGNIGLTPGAILKVSSISGGKVAAPPSRKCGARRSSEGFLPACSPVAIRPGRALRLSLVIKVCDRGARAYLVLFIWHPRGRCEQFRLQVGLKLFDCRTDVKAVIEQRSGYAVTVRFSERSLYDCRPVSLFGNASVRGLGDELAMPIDRRRFRANLYADWAEDRPYRENELVGRTLQLGERLRLAVLERDPRCKMITIDP